MLWGKESIYPISASPPSPYSLWGESGCPQDADLHRAPGHACGPHTGQSALTIHFSQTDCEKRRWATLIHLWKGAGVLFWEEKRWHVPQPTQLRDWPNWGPREWRHDRHAYRKVGIRQTMYSDGDNLAASWKLSDSITCDMKEQLRQVRLSV